MGPLTVTGCIQKRNTEVQDGALSRSRSLYLFNHQAKGGLCLTMH